MQSQSSESNVTSELCAEIARLHKVIYSLAEQIYGWYERQYVQNFLDKLRSRVVEYNYCRSCGVMGSHRWQCPERPTYREGDTDCEKCGAVGGHYLDCPNDIEVARRIVEEVVEEVSMGPKFVYGGGGEVKGYTNTPDTNKRHKEGNKYIRTIYPKWPDSGQTPIQVDIYRVLSAYGVTNPAAAHAIKKLLCAGLRGKADALTDLKEALESVEEAIVVHQQDLDRLPKPTCASNEGYTTQKPNDGIVGKQRSEVPTGGRDASDVRSIGQETGLASREGWEEERKRGESRSYPPANPYSDPESAESVSIRDGTHPAIYPSGGILNLRKECSDGGKGRKEDQESS